MTHSPLEVEMILHFHCSPTPWRNTSSAAIEVVQRLANEGILEPTQESGVFTTTTKGKFWVEAILSVPFPITKFEIPE